MSIPSTVPCGLAMSSNSTPNNVFLTLLPVIERHARMFFRATRCVYRRYDQLAEVIALCWKCYLRLTQRGKDVTRFATVLAHYVCRAVRNGRRLCGQERTRDVLSVRAPQRRAFTVEWLPIASRTSHHDLYASIDAWDQGGWHHRKHVEMRNLSCMDLEELHLELHLAIGRLRQKPHLIHSFFANAGLRL
jgi:hypothetical protein